MEVALSSLKSSVNEQEFLELTRTVLRIIQNILNDPDNAKCRTIRADSKFVQQKREVSQLLEAIGFKLKQGMGEVEDYVFEEELDVFLVERKNKILVARREVNSVMGWDVPSSSLKFSVIQGKGKFGDIFIGCMDGQAILIKVLQTDCNQDAKATFNRELDILSKVKHPNIVQLHGVTLTSDPTSLILEHVPHRLLDVLYSKDISEPDVLRYGRQLASAMQYLHQKEILHCSLAAKNLLIAADDKLRLTEFGMSCWVGTLHCRLPPSSCHMLNVRWMAPEAITDLVLTKHSDIWSFGVVLYEMITGGSVPYATFSNSEVQSKVNAGYQLPHPQGCHEATYCLMRHCWARQPSDRPSFSEIIRRHLEPLAVKLASAGMVRTTSSQDEHFKRSNSMKLSSSKKVKELSYQSVASKGGGLVCIYTAFISPFQRRVVVVCSHKSTVGEATATALAKCGKQDQNQKSHQLVLVRCPSSDSPACYLDPTDKIMAIKAGSTPTSMFVLCTSMPGQAPLEIITSVRQNPAYGFAFLSGMCGYLVRMDGRCSERSWCVLDGSTLRCKEDKNEGMKQLESFLDLKACTVEPVTKGKRHIFKVCTSVGSQYLFLATSKDDMLQWVESISSSSSLDPSPMILQTSDGGAVIQTGFINLQEFAHHSIEARTGTSSCSLKPLVQRRLGTDATFTGTYAAVDYGKQWTVLRSSGLVQCMVQGQPENLFNLSECRQVKVHNPKEMREGEEYSIQVDTSESTLVLKAVLPTEHSDWVLFIEQTLRKLDQLKLIEGHRKRESGYVALKRLLLMGTGSEEGQNSTASPQLYCLPKMFDDIGDVYDAPKHSPPPSAGVGEHTGGHTKPLQKPAPLDTVTHEQNSLKEEGEEKLDNWIPLPPRDYLPPPLPPRADLPPPLPPKRNASSSSSSSFLQHHCPVGSESSSNPDTDDNYVLMMQSSSRQSSVFASPSNSHQSSFYAWDTSQSPCRQLAFMPSSTFCNNTNSVTSPCNFEPFDSPLFSPPPVSQFSQVLAGDDGSKSSIKTTAEAKKLERINCNDNGRSLLEEHAPHPVSKAANISRQASCTSQGCGSSSDDLPEFPSGWSRVYCEKACKHFFFNSHTGSSTWNIQEVMIQQGYVEAQPGSGWKLVMTDNGQPYYYHEQTRHTTWNLQETLTQDS